jgi:outer membrane protein TolC
LEARTVLLLYDLRNAERHIAFHHAALAPQADQLVESSRSAYAAGKITLSELIDSLRMRLDIRRMLAEYRVEREKLLVGLEALAAGDPS